MKQWVVLGGATVVAALLQGCAAPMTKSASADSGIDPNYDATQQKAVKLTQTSRGAEITFDARVLFDTGKAEVKSDGQVAIDRVASLLKERSAANVLIEGHTDNVGAAPLNQKLSEQRADSARRIGCARCAASAHANQGLRAESAGGREHDRRRPHAESPRANYAPRRVGRAHRWQGRRGALGQWA